MRRFAWFRSFAVCIAVGVTLAGCLTLSLADQIAALMREGQEAYTAKRYDDALGKYGQVVKLDAKHWPAYLGLARSSIGKGNWVDAIGSARQAYQLSPSSGEVTSALVESLFGGGIEALKANRFKDAIGYLGDYIKLQPNSTTAYLNIGKAFLGERQYAPALDAFVKGLGVAGGGAERGELVKGLFDGGSHAFAANDYRGAIGFFREYVKVDRSNWQGYLNLAKSYWNAGDRTDALDAFRQVLQLNPGNAEALRFMLGR
jgi:tetratricopeptide (TPR) repeat protein